MTDDGQLLREFAAGSERAFREIVERHSGLVYHTALRQTGNTQAAEEVTQAVFIALAQKASGLGRSVVLAGWLFRATRFAAANLRREEERRRRREQEAFMDQSDISSGAGDSAWEEMAPRLNDALEQLPRADRDAILVRFFENKNHGDAARALGVTESTARMRASRAVEKLRRIFARHGLSIPSAALLAALSARAAQAAPASVASTITAAALGQGAAASAPAAAALAHKTLTLMAWSKTQSVVVAAAVLILAGGAAVRLVRLPPAAPRELPAVETPSSVRFSAPREASGNAAGAPGGAMPAPVPAAARSTVFSRLVSGDEEVIKVPREQIDAFVAQNRTNAASLLAAYNTSGDLEYLRTAAKLFPNDPSILAQVATERLFPDDQAAWIEQFKRVAPDNPLANYLAARDHFKSGKPDLALQELSKATGKPRYEDYTLDRIQSSEELYLFAGHSAAEAKALGMHGAYLPQYAQLVEVSRSLLDLQKQYQAAGDAASAQSAAQLGLGMADQLRIGGGSGNVLAQKIGHVMEGRIVRQLDPSQNYPFLRQPIAQTLEEYERYEAHLSRVTDFLQQWMLNASEPEIVIYFDRVKLYGEAAAIEWLQQRSSAP